MRSAAVTSAYLAAADDEGRLWFAGRKAPDNPWGEGATTLEWTLSSPPPYHQFEQLPQIDDFGRH